MVLTRSAGRRAGVLLATGAVCAATALPGCSSATRSPGAAAPSRSASAVTVTVDTMTSDFPARANNRLSAGPGPCTELEAHLGNSQVDAGHQRDLIVLINTSTRPCALWGYPSVAVADRNGSRVATRITHDGGQAFYTEPARRLVVQPSGEASFNVAWQRVPEGVSDVCRAGSAYIVGAPIAARTAYLPIDVSPCSHGLLAVSAFVPGNVGINA